VNLSLDLSLSVVRLMTSPRRSSISHGDLMAPDASEETLVDNLNFVFSHDSPLNTSIRGPGRVMLYQVWSDLAQPTVTRVVRHITGETVAVIQWSSFGFHKVSLAHGPPHKVGKVLETGSIYNK
jgi:hypothetical protein